MSAEKTDSLNVTLIIEEGEGKADFAPGPVPPNVQLWRAYRRDMRENPNTPRPYRPYLTPPPHPPEPPADNGGA